MSSIDQRNTYLTNLSEITQTTPFISQVNMNGTFVEAKVNNPTQVELMATSALDSNSILLQCMMTVF